MASYYRVSFYRKSESIAGRAPRYMVDIEADSVKDAQAKVMKQGNDVVVRGTYKPTTSIPEKISYVFVTPKDRNKWYKNHKSEQKDRLCHECHKNIVERYKRICDECLKKRSVKPCVLCKQDIQIPNRYLYCDKCRGTWKKTQEKLHRERRAKRKVVTRIRKQLQWAKKQLLKTTLLTCKFAYRYQGLRRPHIEEKNKNRCRTCLQKFVDVQTIYLDNLLTGEQAEAGRAGQLNRREN